jgi:menaquinone-specific isochorismate synthase
VKAVTRALEPGPAIEPAAVAGDHGLLLANESLILAAQGRTAVFELPGGLADRRGVLSVHQGLRAIERDDRVGLPGTGPIALGSLPFESGAPAALVVPTLLYGRDATGTEWATVVSDQPVEPTRDLVLAALTDPCSVAEGPLRVVSAEPADYAGAVAHAQGEIRRGVLDKVVLARRLVVEFDRPTAPSAVLRRLASREPSATAFLAPGPGVGTFVGASPELLVSRRGRRVRSHPLAGTAAPDHSQRLLDSVKDLDEHRLVVRDIVSTLEPRCEELRLPAAPTLVPLASMTHLGTPISGRLRAVAGGIPSALELVAALHPTPAVAGVPRDRALALIGQLEPGGRGPWAGPVGWLDAAGDGDFVLGLRSLTLSGRRAELWAGAGVVSASDPSAELAETDLKLAAVLGCLAPGAERLVLSR